MSHTASVGNDERDGGTSKNASDANVYRPETRNVELTKYHRKV